MKSKLKEFDGIYNNNRSQQGSDRMGQEPFDKENISNDLYSSVFHYDYRPGSIKIKHRKKI